MDTTRLGFWPATNSSATSDQDHSIAVASRWRRSRIPRCKTRACTPEAEQCDLRGQWMVSRYGASRHRREADRSELAAVDRRAHGGRPSGGLARLLWSLCRCGVQTRNPSFQLAKRRPRSGLALVAGLRQTSAPTRFASKNRSQSTSVCATGKRQVLQQHKKGSTVA